MMKLKRLMLAGTVVVAALACACSGRVADETASGRPATAAPAAATEHPTVEPGRAALAAHVHEMLVQRCGSMDCHGGVDHRLRIESRVGIRREGLAVGREPTTSAEVEATFASIAAVGADTVVRKARGQLDHGGGAHLFIGEPGDQCLADWLGVPRASGPIMPADAPVLTHEEACTQALSLFAYGY